MKNYRNAAAYILIFYLLSFANHLISMQIGISPIVSHKQMRPKNDELQKLNKFSPEEISKYNPQNADGHIA